MLREDDFQKRRNHLEKLSDEQLEKRFWEYADKVVKPLVDLAENHTSPSIERSVLLRMGFSSLEAGDIVRHCQKHGYLGKGAGNVVLKLAELKKIDYQQAGLLLAKGNGWDEIAVIFGKGHL